VEEIIASAEIMYLDGLHQDALYGLEEADDFLNDLVNRAVGWKDRALLWIYVIEWAAETGTLTIVGCFTYMLMLKRSCTAMSRSPGSDRSDLLGSVAQLQLDRAEGVHVVPVATEGRVPYLGNEDEEIGGLFIVG